jgi:hypothetical protein
MHHKFLEGTPYPLTQLRNFRPSANPLLTHEQPHDIAACTQRFNDVICAHSRVRHRRCHAEPNAAKNGIVELRQKGVALRLIRELLASGGVAVGTDTVTP